jgi:hypothetical protein
MFKRRGYISLEETSENRKANKFNPAAFALILNKKIDSHTATFPIETDLFDLADSSIQKAVIINITRLAQMTSTPRA